MTSFLVKVAGHPGQSQLHLYDTFSIPSVAARADGAVAVAYRGALTVVLLLLICEEAYLLKC